MGYTYELGGGRVVALELITMTRCRPGGRYFANEIYVGGLMCELPQCFGIDRVVSFRTVLDTILKNVGTCRLDGLLVQSRKKAEMCATHRLRGLGDVIRRGAATGTFTSPRALGST